MKTLPDNPHLDHLRQQAKDLLSGLRETKPDTSLSDAQTALAQQYGFRTWTDLKDEVDRQRGVVDVVDEMVAVVIADRYDLGEVEGPMRSLARPDESGRRWLLHTDRGRWEARTMDGWISSIDADTGVRLQENAAHAGVGMPMPVRSRDGVVIERIANHSWRIDEWIPTGPPLSAPVNSTVAYAAGEVLATLHGLGMPAERICPYHSRRLTDVSWAALTAKAKAAEVDWSEDLAGAVPVLSELERIGEGVEPPEPVLSHNNLTPGNVRQGEDGRLIVVGWQAVAGQPPSWELAKALKQWTIDPDGTVNVASVKAMLGGYRFVAGVLPRLDLAMFRGATVSYASYVFDQVEYALNATDEADKRYASRNVRHLFSVRLTRDHIDQLVEIAESD